MANDEKSKDGQTAQIIKAATPAWKNASNMIKGLIVVIVGAAIVLIFVNPWKKEIPSYQHSATTTGNNSPALNMSGSNDVHGQIIMGNSNIVPQNNVSGSNSGNVTQLIGNSNTVVTVNPLNITLSITYVQYFVSNAPPSQALAPNDLYILTNEMLLAAHFYLNRSYDEASQHATNGVHIMEMSPEAPISDVYKGHVYTFAAECVDELKRNGSEVAYDLAKKGFGFDQSNISRSIVLLTSHNLASKCGRSGNWRRAFDLEEQAISLYLSDPSYFNSLVDSNGMAQLFAYGCVYATQLGYFDKANSYAETAHRMNLSDELSYFSNKYTILIKEGKTYEAEQYQMAYSFIRFSETNNMRITNKAR
jgi:hypothetical protein